MKILLTGATGFVGGYILDELKKITSDVRCIVRPVSNKSTSKKIKQQKTERESIVNNGFEIYEGDLFDLSAIKNAFDGIDIAINLIGIIVERGENTFEKIHHKWVSNLINISIESNIKKIIHMSALGARYDATSKYHRTKWMGEDAIRKSGVTYTIFKPSVITGRGDGFNNILIDLVKKLLFIPTIGSGNNRLQPVSARDVARCFVQAVTDQKTDNKTFELGGEKNYTLNEMIDIAEEKLLHRKGVKFRIHIPAFMVIPAAFLMERIFFNTPVTVDQIRMMREDNICDYFKL